jgi:hypothetical protein
MSAPPNQIVMNVKLPPGARPNDRVNVSTPDGRIVVIIVPPGCEGGQYINVSVNDDYTTNSSTTMGRSEGIQPTDIRSNRAAIGAATAAAVTGLILIGPVTGVVIAGVALYATTREDSIGDAVRSGGAAACSAFDFGMKKAKDHNVFERLKEAGTATYRKAVAITDEAKASGTTGR